MSYYKKGYNPNERYIHIAEDDSDIYQDKETMEILSDYVILERLNEQDKRIKELEEENKQLKEELGSFEQVSFTDLCDKSRTILYMKKENVGDMNASM